jgi:hypothetical protein
MSVTIPQWVSAVSKEVDPVSAMLEIGSMPEARSIAAALCVRTLWDARQVAIHWVSKSQRICSSTLRDRVTARCAAEHTSPKSDEGHVTDFGRFSGH